MLLWLKETHHMERKLFDVDYLWNNRSKSHLKKRQGNTLQAGANQGFL